MCPYMFVMKLLLVQKNCIVFIHIAMQQAHQFSRVVDIGIKGLVVWKSNGMATKLSLWTF